MQPLWATERVLLHFWKGSREFTVGQDRRGYYVHEYQQNKDLTGYNTRARFRTAAWACRWLAGELAEPY